MKENKLIDLSMEFSVEIINLVKILKSNHESIIANQIGEAELLSALIFTKHNMRKAQKILYPNLKLPLKRQVKRDIGLNYYIKQSILMKKPLKD